MESFCPNFLLPYIQIRFPLQRQEGLHTLRRLNKEIRGHITKIVSTLHVYIVRGFSVCRPI
jgi:hypothetical protein